VLSQDQLLEALSFFLLRVPARDAEDGKPARPAFTIFPRYHQSRLVRRIAEDITAHFAATGDIGKKYLADHSAGSGKTLSICWLADRLHSLFKPGTNEKLVDITFILTDRKSLDTNIREDIDKFTHLKDVVGIAKGRRPAAFPQRAQTHHRHHPAEVRLGAGGDPEEPGLEDAAGGVPDR
jgi:type I restriction enzyme, R subunit